MSRKRWIMGCSLALVIMLLITGALARVELDGRDTALPYHNHTAIVDPPSGECRVVPYTHNSLWFNIQDDRVFQCRLISLTEANWRPVGQTQVNLPAFQTLLDSAQRTIITSPDQPLRIVGLLPDSVALTMHVEESNEIVIGATQATNWGFQLSENTRFALKDRNAADIAYVEEDGTASGFGGGGYATIQEQGTPLTQRTTINCVGTSITCADNAGSTRTDLTVQTLEVIRAGAASASLPCTDPGPSTNWYSFWGTQTTAESTNTGQFGRAGTVREMRVRQSANTPSGQSVVYTLRINGSDSVFACTIGAGASTCNDTDSVAVAATDTGVFRSQCSGGTTAFGNVAITLMVDF